MAINLGRVLQREGEVVALADSACWQCEGLLLTHGPPLGWRLQALAKTRASLQGTVHVV